MLSDVDHLIDAVEAARVGHGAYIEAQKTGFAQSFDLQDTPSSERAAHAIAERVLAKARQTA